jgi:hypothetical protein
MPRQLQEVPVYQPESEPPDDRTQVVVTGLVLPFTDVLLLVIYVTAAQILVAGAIMGVMYLIGIPPFD